MAIKISNNTIIDDARIVTNASKVGVGTTNPITNLDVRGNTSISGSVGVGTTNPITNLDVRGNTSISGSVGVGTTNPLNALVVVGDARISGSVGIGTTVSGIVGDLKLTSVNNGGPVSGLRNLIINGNFDVWQRGISTTTTNKNGLFSADRWWTGVSTTGSGQVTSISRQGFTTAQTDVPYNPSYFFRWNETTVGTGYSYKSIYYNGIENVEMLSNELVTLSFYAKANTNITLPSINIDRGYASPYTTLGNYEYAAVVVATNVGITASWQKFVYTFRIPSVSGKPINRTKFLGATFIEWRLPTSTTFTFDLAQVQLELGSIPTRFETRPLAIERELCQRYYETSYIEGTRVGTANTFDGATGHHTSNTNAYQWTVHFNTRKAYPPIVRTYSTTTGTLGNVRGYAGGPSFDYNADTYYIGEQSFVSGGTGMGSTIGYVEFHWTAQSEL